jgi:hypothetical protein
MSSEAEDFIIGPDSHYLVNSLFEKKALDFKFKIDGRSHFKKGTVTKMEAYYGDNFIKMTIDLRAKVGQYEGTVSVKYDLINRRGIIF